MNLIFLDNNKESDKFKNIFFELCRLYVHIFEKLSDLKKQKTPEFVWLNVTSFQAASYKYPNLVFFGYPNTEYKI